MFCHECGASVTEGSKFCLSCGSKLPTPNAVVQQPSPPVVMTPPVQQEDNRKKKVGSFWHSGAAIALIVILGIAVIAGVTFGIIFLVKGSSNNTADAETVRVWDEYDTLVADDSANFTTIKLDSASLTKAQEDLKNSQEKVVTLERTLKNAGGTKVRRQGAKNGASVRDIKADQMAAALAAYSSYVTKMNQLFTTLVGANLLDPNVVNTLNNILAELQTLSAKVKTASNDFLANNTKVVTGTFNPPILASPKTIATEVQNGVTAAQTAEQQRLAGDKAAADQAAANAAAQQKQQQQANSFMCPNCNGTGMTPGGTCGVCNGTGLVTYQELINKGWYESDNGWMPPDTSY